MAVLLRSRSQATVWPTDGAKKLVERFFNKIKQYRRIGNALRPRQSHEDAGHKRQDRYNYPQMDKDRSDLLVR